MSLIQRARNLTHVGNLLHDANSGLRFKKFMTGYIPGMESAMTHGIESLLYTPDVVALHDDDPPSDTDYTTEASNETANDVPCMPATGAVADGLYLGDAAKFNTIKIRIDTAGVGTWAYTLKYWDEVAVTWVAITAYFAQGDEINDFKSTGHNGWCWSSFTMPANWGLYTLMGQELYWVKFEITSFTSVTTVPLAGKVLVGDFWT